MGKRSGRPDRRMRERVALEESDCWICGHPINYDLPRTDPMSYEMDHKNAIANGGETVRSNVAASHRKCNRGKGARRVEASEAHRRSRDW